MSLRYKDCPACRVTAHLGRCGTCANTRKVPKAPPVSETVVYYEPLTGYFKEEVEAGRMSLERDSDVLLSPRALIVTHADAVRRGGESGTRVEVSGWILARSGREKDRPPVKRELAKWVEGLGWVIPGPRPPALTYVEGISGPAAKPGHWNWRGDPQ